MSVLLSQFVLPSPPSTVSTSLFLHLHLHSFPTNRLICPIFLDAIHMHDIQYLLFSFWVSSLCITDSRFIYLTTSDWNSFLFMAEWYFIIYMYDIFIHSSGYRHPGCFHALLVVNRAAKNIHVHVSLWFGLIWLWFSQGLCPAVGLLGHMVILFLDC